MPAVSTESYNEGASTSSSVQQAKQDRKRSVPWIEKYRPQVFDDIMGLFSLIN